MNNQQMMELTTVEKSEFEQLVSECTRSGSIDSNLYIEYDVKRGLRDSNGNGVLTGLTEISDERFRWTVNYISRDTMWKILSRVHPETVSVLRK